MAHTPVGPGTLLAGRFVLEDLLDDTEGARFWRATDRILARNVAVHVIAADDPRSAALLNAARTSATVTDGHLLRVLDAATEDGVTYVVNEWGHGLSLDRLLVEGPLSARRAAWVAKEVAEAISTAHRHGIAHGRLLPENVMVSEAGAVKLIGFVVDAVIRGRDEVRVPGGPPLGEHEADVVNLAALLYAGLTARWPGTEGSAVPAAPTEHGRPLRPRQVRAGVPRPLDTICERVLGGGGAGAPALETAHEIYAALCDFVGDSSGAAPVGFEPTAFFDDQELAELRGTATPGPAGPEPASAGADGEATAAWAPGADPEATQASAPPPGLPADRAGVRHAPSPPPPFPPQEARPLFVPEEPRTVRAPGATVVPPRSTGPGGGPVPSSWGPDDDDPEAPDWDTSSWTEDPPGRSWLRLALVVGAVAVVVVAVVVAFNLGQGRGILDGSDASPAPAQSSAAAEPVRVVAIRDFDPVGDGSENPETAPLAVDGDQGTAWRTVTYYDPLELQKDGVGLLLDLGRPTEVREATISFLGSPTSFELLAAGETAGAPTDAGGLTRVARRPGAGTRAQLVLDEPVTTRYLVLWLKVLPPAEGGFRGQVAEIELRG